MYFFLYLPLHSSFSPSVSSHSFNYSCTLLCHLYIFILYFIPTISFIFSWTLYSCSPLSSTSPLVSTLALSLPIIFLGTLLLIYLCQLSLLLSILTLYYSLSRLGLYSCSSPFRKICLWVSSCSPSFLFLSLQIIIGLSLVFYISYSCPLPSAIDLHLHSVLACYSCLYTHISVLCSLPPLGPLFLLVLYYSSPCVFLSLLKIL